MGNSKVIQGYEQDFFEDLWKQGDRWDLETSSFEQAKYARQLEILDGFRYERALEIGCGAGWFTFMLHQLADHVTGVDISPTAIARARERAKVEGTEKSVEFHVANIMDYDLSTESRWDLVVLSETMCFLGWMYTFFEVGWLAKSLVNSSRLGGKLLMANTFNSEEDYLLDHWIIRTYHSLFLNVGYQLEAEEIFRGTKAGVDMEVLITLYSR